MFRKILVPISSEQPVPTSALRRACSIAHRFDAEVLVLYVIEERRLQEMEDHAEHVLTHQLMENLGQEISRVREMSANRLVFSSIDALFQEEGVRSRNRATTGEYSPEILKLVESEGVELIVLEFEGTSLLNFRIFEESPVPVWVEEEGKGMGKRGILAVCSNRSPNQRAPDMALRLGEAFGSRVHFLYVSSPFDTDSHLPHLSCSEEERQEAEGIYQGMDRRCPGNVELVQEELVEGTITSAVLKKSQELDPFLVILGRVEEREYMVELHMGVKRQLARKCAHNILLAK